MPVTTPSESPRTKNQTLAGTAAANTNADNKANELPSVDIAPDESPPITVNISSCHVTGTYAPSSGSIAPHVRPLTNAPANSSRKVSCGSVCNRRRLAASLEHRINRRQGLNVTDFYQRIGGAFADPPVVVGCRLDELVDGAFVPARVEDLDSRTADVVVLVLDELQHGVDDTFSTDSPEGVRGAGAHPPILIGDGFE